MNALARKRQDEPPFDPAEELFTYEIIDGEEMMSPRPARKHINAACQLFAAINANFGRRGGGKRGSGGWLIVMEPELHLSRRPDKVSPNLCGWRKDRAPEIDNRAAFTSAPDWACEVLSPRTRTWDRKKKMPLYARHRVGHLWMVDPLVEELEVYALGRRGWELIATHSGPEVVWAEPFEALELDLSYIWPEVPHKRPASSPSAVPGVRRTRQSRPSTR